MVCYMVGFALYINDHISSLSVKPLKMRKVHNFRTSGLKNR